MQPPLPEKRPHGAEQQPSTDAPHSRSISWLSGLVVAAEVNPVTNSGLRLAAAAALGIATRSPEAIGLFMVGATALYEIPGVFATAWLLNTERGGRLTTGVNNLVTAIRRRLGNGNEDSALHGNVHPLLAAAIAMVLGPPALLAIRQTLNPELTMQENVRYGIPIAAGVSAAVGAESFFVSSGIAHVQPTEIGLALAGVAGLVLAARHINNLRRGGDEQPGSALPDELPPEEE